MIRNGMEDPPNELDRWIWEWGCVDGILHCLWEQGCTGGCHRVQLLFSHGSWVMRHDRSPWVMGHVMPCKDLPTHGSWAVQGYAYPMDHELCEGMLVPWVMGRARTHQPVGHGSHDST